MILDACLIGRHCLAEQAPMVIAHFSRTGNLGALTLFQSLTQCLATFKIFTLSQLPVTGSQRVWCITWQDTVTLAASGPYWQDQSIRLQGARTKTERAALHCQQTCKNRAPQVFDQLGAVSAEFTAIHHTHDSAALTQLPSPIPTRVNRDGWTLSSAVRGAREPIVVFRKRAI